MEPYNYQILVRHFGDAKKAQKALADYVINDIVADLPAGWKWEDVVTYFYTASMTLMYALQDIKERVKVLEGILLNR